MRYHSEIHKYDLKCTIFNVGESFFFVEKK